MRSSPKVVEKLLTKGWIEKNLFEGRLCYRVTDQGLAAKKGLTCHGVALSSPNPQGRLSHVSLGAFQYE
jgi:hypothetical protein